MLIIVGKPIKFGDIIQGQDKIYYIDPHRQKIEPAFVIGNFDENKIAGTCRVEVVLIPEQYRNRPMMDLPIHTLRKIVFTVDKNHTMALVSTVPPTIYCTTLKELEEWVLQSGGSLIKGIDGNIITK